VAGGGLDVDATLVGDVMTEKPTTLEFDAELVYALNKMTVGGYRHLPLLKNGEPVAVVAMRDIVEYIVSLYQDYVLKSGDEPSQILAHDREGA
jgi:signal-transduction protein with cAMP-binding, CBS, and nucleotidyltransferase domain